MKNSDTPAANDFKGRTPADRLPREKALSFGLKALSDAELMAIVFGTGTRGVDVMRMCDDILKANQGHLSRIASQSAQEFERNNKGIGPAKALTLLAGIELGIRAAADALVVEDRVIASSQAAFRYMNQYLYNLDHEEFWVLYLKTSLKPLKAVCISRGGIAMTAVDVRIVVRGALMMNSTAMMLFHNHPSGTLAPSGQDDSLTRKIKDAAALFDIRVLDHLIIGNQNFFSYHDEGKL